MTNHRFTIELIDPDAILEFVGKINDAPYQFTDKDDEIHVCERGTVIFVSADCEGTRATPESPFIPTSEVIEIELCEPGRETWQYMQVQDDDLNWRWELFTPDPYEYTDFRVIKQVTQ